MPEDLAIKVAETVNNAFGSRAPRGMRHLYAIQFKNFAWNEVSKEVLDVVAMLFWDVLPMQRGIACQEEIRHSWAYKPPAVGALRHGLRKLHMGTAHTDQLYKAARKNARSRNIPFELTMENVGSLLLNSDGRCAVTGISLSRDHGTLPQGRKMRRPWAPSIDRIDSSKGYSPENCRIVCCAANFAMSQWGEDVLIEMAKAIARRRIKRMVG